MINIKDNNIVIQKPFNIIGSNYTLLLQNTVTKDINIYNVTDESENLYFHFKIDNLNLINGEYYLLLISNENHLPLEVITNDINSAKLESVYLLLCKDKLIINKDIQIITTLKNAAVEIVTKELCKVGDYTTIKKEYNNKKSFITYNG